MKYIVLDSLGAATDVPIMFPNFVQHVEIANALGGVENVLSAGMYSVDSEGKASCWGKSVSLGKESREEDEKLINKVFQRY